LKCRPNAAEPVRRDIDSFGIGSRYLGKTLRTKGKDHGKYNQPQRGPHGFLPRKRNRGHVAQ
jgi:hypothetical protein